MNKLYDFDREYKTLIIGVDEAGRGPLAGPVVAAAAVIKGYSSYLDEVNDSKKLTESKRERIFENILNDNNKVLVSDNISLKAKEDILNRNGSIIYATNKLNIESNNLDNLGNVKSYGTYIKKWISANGDVFDESNIDNWKLNISDKYKDFRWFRGN